MKRIAALFLALGMVLTAGCAEKDQDEPEQREVFAMDTAMVLTVYGEDAFRAANAAEEEICRLDSLLSRTNEASKVSLLNSAGGKMVPVGVALCDLIQTAATYTELTEGAFDITIAPVVSAWGFTTDHYQVPDPEELETLLTYVGMEHVHLSGKSSASSGYENASLDPGTQIDLGGIAKGYASDRLAAIFQEHEIPRALASLGGNVLAWGSKADGAAWRVGIQDPNAPSDPNAYVGILQLTDAFAVTSGSYERKFEVDGTTYHHILDPATGYPAESGLLSVTAVSSDGMLADGLSTACYVMGAEQSVRLWREHGLEGAGFDLVLVREDGSVWITEGLEDGLDFRGEEAGYTYEIIRR